MEKATEKQVEFIKTLSERFQKAVPNFEELSLEDAKVLIDEWLTNGKPSGSQVKADINPVQWGLALKLVYQNWTRNNSSPLKDKENFIQEVKNTYLLFEF